MTSHNANEFLLVGQHMTLMVSSTQKTGLLPPCGSGFSGSLTSGSVEKIAGEDISGMKDLNSTQRR